MVIDTRGTPREHSDQVNKVANAESSPNTSEMERNSTDMDDDPSSASNSGKESTGNNAAKSTTPAKSLFPSTDDSASLVESFDKKKKFQQDLETGMVKFNQSAKKGTASRFVVIVVGVFWFLVICILIQTCALSHTIS